MEQTKSEFLISNFDSIYFKMYDLFISRFDEIC